MDANKRQTTSTITQLPPKTTPTPGEEDPVDETQRKSVTSKVILREDEEANPWLRLTKRLESPPNIMTWGRGWTNPDEENISAKVLLSDSDEDDVNVSHNHLDYVTGVTLRKVSMLYCPICFKPLRPPVYQVPFPFFP